MPVQNVHVEPVISFEAIKNKVLKSYFDTHLKKFEFEISGIFLRFF